MKEIQKKKKLNKDENERKTKIKIYKIYKKLKKKF